MKQISIRNVPLDLARKLQTERRRRGVSLNQIVIDLLRQALGLGSEGRYENGLRRLSGTWSEEELASFETDTALFEQVDEELWR